MTEEKERAASKDPPDTTFVTKDEVREILREHASDTDEKLEQLRSETTKEISKVRDITLNTNQTLQQLKTSFASLRTSQNLATLFTGVFVTILMKIINHFFN